MIMPIKCPICNDPMVNDWHLDANNSSALKKVCSKRLGHQIYFLSTHNFYDDVERVIWLPESTIQVHWIMHPEELRICQPRGNLNLPFFMPDFSNIPKLKQKIKTYVVFS